jgi:hypothetical protein
MISAGSFVAGLWSSSMSLMFISSKSITGILHCLLDISPLLYS